MRKLFVQARIVRRQIAVLAILVSLGLVGEGLEPASAVEQVLDAGSEDRFVQLANEARAGAGLGPLALDGQLISNARNHSSQMASSGSIYHNSQLPSQITGNWRSLGENVGIGGSADSIHSAFMASASHRANILGDYDRVGIGVIVAGGTIYVTEVFWKTAPAPTVGAATATSALSAPAAVTKCRVVRGRRKCTRVKARAKKRTRRR